MNQNMNYNAYPNQYQSNVYPNYPVNNPPKKKAIWPFIVIPIVAFIAIIVVGGILLFTQLRKTEKYLAGDWKCSIDEGISFNTSDKVFEIYSIGSTKQVVVRGKYKVRGYSIHIENGDKTYQYSSVLTAKNDSNKEVVNNYDITIYGNKQEMMDLHDTTRDQWYQCKKVS